MGEGFGKARAVYALLYDVCFSFCLAAARPLLYNDQILIFILFGGAQEGNERGELRPNKTPLVHLVNVAIAEILDKLPCHKNPNFYHLARQAR